MKLRLTSPLVLLLLLLLVTQLFAADWYVSVSRGSNKSGDGSIANPYKAIEEAVKQTQPGDTIRIAAGHYPGLAKCGHWVIEKNNLTFVGGYNEEFTARDPFGTISLLAWDDSESNKSERWPEAEFQGIKDESGDSAFGLGGITIDGLVFDGGPRNKYFEDPENPTLRTDQTPNDTLLMLEIASGATGIVRNCTFLNPGVAPGAILSGRPGSKFEVYNNVFVNGVHHQLDAVCKTDNKQNRCDFSIHHNTFVFAWKTTAGGSGVRVHPYTNCDIHHNIFAWGDFNGVNNQFYEKRLDARGVPKNGLVNDQVKLDYNLFHMYQDGVYGFVLEGRSGNLSAWELIDLEDSSVASARGNEIGDPVYEYNKTWMRIFLNRSDAIAGAVKMDPLNLLLAFLGFPVRSEEGSGKEGWCCRYPLADVMAFRHAASEYDAEGNLKADYRGATRQLME